LYYGITTVFNEENIYKYSGKASVLAREIEWDEIYKAEK